jgi:GTP-binding protein
VKKFSEALLSTWEALPPIYITSAEKKQGKKAILADIAAMNEVGKEVLKRNKG